MERDVGFPMKRRDEEIACDHTPAASAVVGILARPSLSPRPMLRLEQLKELISRGPDQSSRCRFKTAFGPFNKRWRHVWPCVSCHAKVLRPAVCDPNRCWWGRAIGRSRGHEGKHVPGKFPFARRQAPVPAIEVPADRLTVSHIQWKFSLKQRRQFVGDYSPTSEMRLPRVLCGVYKSPRLCPVIGHQSGHHHPRVR